MLSLIVGHHKRELLLAECLFCKLPIKFCCATLELNHHSVLEHDGIVLLEANL